MDENLKLELSTFEHTAECPFEKTNDVDTMPKFFWPRYKAHVPPVQPQYSGNKQADLKALEKYKKDIDRYYLQLKYENS